VSSILIWYPSAGHQFNQKNYFFSTPCLKPKRAFLSFFLFSKTNHFYSVGRPKTVTHQKLHVDVTSPLQINEKKSKFRYLQDLDVCNTSAKLFYTPHCACLSSLISHKHYQKNLKTLMKTCNSLSARVINCNNEFLQIQKHQ
jgi:hypothetical protein